MDFCACPALVLQRAARRGVGCGFGFFVVCRWYAGDGEGLFSVLQWLCSYLTLDPEKEVSVARFQPYKSYTTYPNGQKNCRWFICACARV